MNNNSSSNSSSNRASIPEAREALDKFKYEVASEIGVPLKQGYNGDLTSAQAGYVGGYMVNIISPEQHKEKTFRRREGMRNMGVLAIRYSYIVVLA